MGDAPDGFQYSNVSEFTASLDSGELAARLYSPTIYARTGQVLFATDFTKGFAGFIPHYETSISSIVLSTLYPGPGGLSAKMTTNSSVYGKCRLDLQIPFIAARYYTVDMGFYIANTDVEIVNELQILYEGQRHLTEMYYDYDPLEVRLTNEDYDEIDVTDLESSDSYFGVNVHIRLTLDIQEYLYKKLEINSVPFAITDMFYTLSSGTYANELNYHLYFGSIDNDEASIYIRWIVISASDSL